MDHIINQAAKMRAMFGGQMKVPLVIRAPGGGGRQLGATHSQTPDAIFAHFPGLKVVAPGTPYDAKGLLKSAIRSDDPVLLMSTQPYINPAVKFRKAITPSNWCIEIQRPGKDVTLVTYSKMVELSLKAAEILAKDGIDVEVIDLRSLRPLDMTPIIESIKKTNRGVIAEKAGFPMGWQRSLCSYLRTSFRFLRCTHPAGCSKRSSLPYNRRLEQSALPQVADIIQAIKEVL
jgi:pyruvate dehydrogenase E1 component beta subunit